jgi:PhnB protein
MPVLDSYLFFNGNCADAMRFYERVLGGKIEMSMTYAESPDPEQCPPGSKDRIMHSSMLVGDRRLMASDTPAGDNKPMQGFGLSLSYPDVKEAKRIFGTLAEGGTTMMPFDKTFWAEGFGMCTDKFGTPWMVGGGEAK